MELPKEKQTILNKIVNDLKAGEKLRAVVLGGSYAAGTATDSSDLDIGIYYYEKEPFDISFIENIARTYSVDSNPTVTGFYEWGPWVNGGAWIRTECGKVDFLYRNIEQVRATIEKAKNGEWENHYEQQPPFGFSSMIYLAETKCCLPLYDPDGIISNLKEAVRVYPPKLKQTVVQQSLWSAEFTIAHAVYFSGKQDTLNTMGCLTRAIKNIVTALFAMNEIYPMGDKRSLEILDKADTGPVDLKGKVEKILYAGKGTMDRNIIFLKDLFNETVALTKGEYKPPYQFG